MSDEKNNYLGTNLLIRFMAIVYDAFIITALSLAYSALITFIIEQIHANETLDYTPTVGGVYFQVGWIFTLLCFYCFFWIKAGQTVGMKAWRLKLISTNGESLHLGQCVIRFFLGIVSFAVLGLGFLWVLIDKHNDTLHDKLCKTRMIRTEKLPKK